MKRRSGDPGSGIPRVGGAALRHFSGVLLDGEAVEQENHPARDFVPVEEKKELKEKKGEKGFKKMVADY